MDQCQDCGYFFNPGELGLVIQHGCPNCGRPYAHQPNPLKDEMTHGLDAMPTSTQDDMSGNPLQEGILADGGFKSRQKRDESFASVRVADEFALEGQEPEQGLNATFPSHTFIVQGDGAVHAAPHPAKHEEIAQTLGDTEAHLNKGSLGWLNSNGTTSWGSNGSGLGPQELQEALSAHFGYPVEVDPSHPNLAVQTQADRFGWDQYHPQMQQEQAAADARGGRPFGYYDNPFINRGGRTAEVDFQTDQIALPGHTTHEVQPSQWGLHGDVVDPLAQLGAYVNGHPAADPEYGKYLVKHWSASHPPGSSDWWHPGEEWEWPQNQGRSVMVSHPDPERAQLAKEIIEQGDRSPLQGYVQKKEAGHPLNLRIPNGITDNLHQTLGNLRAWVESPYENGQLRPYIDYHRALRPQLNQRAGGAIRIGVQNPQMGEILNHVGQTDDMTPLYEYRGVKNSPKTSMAAAGELLGGSLLGGGAAAGGAEAAGAGAAAGGGAAAAGGAGASGVGGLMGGALSEGPLGTALQVGQAYRGAEGIHDMMGGGQNGGAAGGGAPAGPAPTSVEDPSYYAAYDSPNAHNEIPKNEDGDSDQKDDGDDHEWQKDYETNGIGGTDSPVADSSPQFDENGTGIQRLKMLLPLIEQFFNSDESGANDPLIQALDQQLEQEIPGYKDHGTPEAAQQLLVVLKPKGEGDGGDIEGEPKEISEAPRDDSDDNEKPAEKESRTDFLPYLPTLEASNDPHFRVGLAPPTPGTTGVGIAPGMPPLAAPGPASPTVLGRCPHCGAVTDPSNTTCPQCGAATSALPGHQGKTADLGGELPNSFMYEHSDIPPGMNLKDWRQQGAPMGGGLVGNTCSKCGSASDPSDLACAVCGAPLHNERMAASHQGPHTPEQISIVQQLLLDQGRTDEVPDVPLHPENYAEELASVIGNDNPPQTPDDGQGGMPEPAQEEAPPGDTMPVPGMQAPTQMMAAVERYASDSVAHPCPKCDSHTTRLLDKDGDSECHSCGHSFKSDIKPITVKDSADRHPHTQDPTADQRHLPHDIEQEQDTSHTWVDGGGNPLQVGQYYELYTKQYNIPDLVRIDAVKPDAITYTLQGTGGLQTSEDVTREEADVMGYRFDLSSEGADTELEPGAADLNNDDNTAFEGSPEMTDMSSPHTMTSAIREAMTAKDFVMLADAISKLQVPNRAEVAQHFANYLATTNPNFDEARFLAAAIGEPMTGRDQFGGDVPQPEQGPLDDNQPGDLYPPEGWTASARDWLNDAAPEKDPGLEWLNDGTFSPRQAGRQYDAWEQRKFIDEDGSARNSDLLDLAGTHYEVTTSDEDSFLFGL